MCDSNGEKEGKRQKDMDIHRGSEKDRNKEGKINRKD